MDIASPFSMLDRMKPNPITLGASRLLAAGAAAAAKDGAARLAQIGTHSPVDIAGHTRPGFSEIIARSDGGGQRPRFDSAAVANDPSARATGLELFDWRAPTSATPGTALTEPQARRRPADRADGMAEIVVAAGFDGLDALARSPTARLATGLAQTTYAALRPLG